MNAMTPELRAKSLGILAGALVTLGGILPHQIERDDWFEVEFNMGGMCDLVRCSTGEIWENFPGWRLADSGYRVVRSQRDAATYV
jgi:hypothetical protein